MRFSDKNSLQSNLPAPDADQKKFNWCPVAPA